MCKRLMFHVKQCGILKNAALYHLNQQILERGFATKGMYMLEKKI